MNKISRTFTFDSAHRLMNYDGPCKNIHGHRYKFTVTFIEICILNGDMIIDFRKIKEILGTWIDNNIDHSLILEKDDPIISVLKSSPKTCDMRLYIINKSPTVENLNDHLHNEILPKLFNSYNVNIVYSKLEETENCFSEISIGG